MSESNGESTEYLKRVFDQQISLGFLGVYDRRLIRKSHTIETPHEHLYLIERKDFERRYDAIVLEGIEMGFLVYNGCPECAGEATIDTSTAVMDLIYDETEGEYATRMRAQFPDGVTFPLHHRPLS